MKRTRREFLGLSLSAAAAAAFPRALWSAAGAGSASAAGAGSAGRFGATAATSARVLRDGFLEIRRGVGIFTARGGTIGWLANRDGTLVVDSQYPDTARDFVAGLDARGTAPVDALVNTHHHGDHTAGNAVIGERARRVVAHSRVPELQRAAAGDAAAEQRYPETTFDREWSARIGDETVRARHRGPAHTGGDCTVHFERAGVVHMGDLIFNRVYPFIDRPGGASIRGWIDVLEAVASGHPPETVYVFGHGRPDLGVTGDRADVLVQRDYLSAVLETASRALREGRSREEAVALERLPGFEDFAALSPRLNLALSLGVAWDELSAGG